MAELRQRQPRVEDPAFLAFVRLRPCRACDAPAPSQAAHLRGADAIFHKRETGKGETPSDRWTLPLCEPCHLTDKTALHKVGEKLFFARLGIDPFASAANLYDEFLLSRPAREPRRAKRASVSRVKARRPKMKSRPFPVGRKMGRRRDG